MSLHRHGPQETEIGLLGSYRILHLSNSAHANFLDASCLLNAAAHSGCMDAMQAHIYVDHQLWCMC